MLNDLIINVSLLISLIFIYINVRRELLHSNPTAFILYLYDGLSGGLMGYFLMNFSIVIDQGTRIDFRYIPIILIFLFINDKAAIISAALIAAARFILGVSLTSYLSIFVLIVLVIGLYVIKYTTRKYESIYLKGSIMVIYATTLYTVFFIQRTYVTAEVVTLLIFFWIVAMAGGLFSLFIMYYLRTAELLLRKYEAESTIDYLTGLSNVRKFYQMLNYYTKKSKTKKRPWLLE